MQAAAAQLKDTIQREVDAFYRTVDAEVQRRLQETENAEAARVRETEKKFAEAAEELSLRECRLAEAEAAVSQREKALSARAAELEEREAALRSREEALSRASGAPEAAESSRSSLVGMGTALRGPESPAKPKASLFGTWSGDKQNAGGEAAAYPPARSQLVATDGEGAPPGNASGVQMTPERDTRYDDVGGWRTWSDVQDEETYAERYARLHAKPDAVCTLDEEDHAGKAHAVVKQASATQKDLIDQLSQPRPAGDCDKSQTEDVAAAVGQAAARAGELRTQFEEQRHASSSCEVEREDASQVVAQASASAGALKQQFQNTRSDEAAAERQPPPRAQLRDGFGHVGSQGASAERSAPEKRSLQDLLKADEVKAHD
eukprot:TRINITY_DN110738_c0_g1_i1.p1 TRINITY_DN110738_c0_g1~~TRINITY_DN110738_c0_g1_i1.p1  ORF type:complete len:376 (+),score=111.95 TRINITY_DN110738_c0_g1_i1:215-1342(+)